MGAENNIVLNSKITNNFTDLKTFMKRKILTITYSDRSLTINDVILTRDLVNIY